MLVLLVFILNIFKSSDEVTHEKNQQTKIQQTKTIKNKKNQEEKELEQEAKYFEEKTKAMEIEYAKDDGLPFANEEFPVKEKSVFKYLDDELETTKKEVQKQEIKPEIKPEEEIEKVIKKEIVKKEVILVNQPPKIKIKSKYTTKENSAKIAKLSIIIDDVTTKKQVQIIKNISYPVTISFLPPTKRHPKSANYTSGLKVFMIHLPLQAQNFRYEEQNTLHIDDGIEKIEKRIQFLKQKYPNTKYINNHTGSRFTSNEVAMDKLMKILKKYNYTFLDSKTTAKSVGKKYAKKHNVPYLLRNIFLDNVQNKIAIRRQLAQAVKIAKKHGFAVAIGHPHLITLKTLKNSTDLLKGVKLVFIDKIKAK
jgi:polysaccharide deacetylase 2 family uncharacterized protein YibQ